MAEFSTEAGGMHPGKPVLWPTGKASSTPLNPSPQTQTPGGVAPTKPGVVAPTTSPQGPAVPAAPQKPVPTITRPLTVADIREHLISIQVAPNDANTKLASLMLRNGVELSRANFVNLTSMLSGTNKSQAMQESALLLLMKGIDSPQAVKILGQYFSDNPGLASQLLALNSSMGNLSSVVGMGKGLLDPNLIAQLTTLLSSLDESFKSILAKSNQGSPISRANMMSDIRALKSLIQGLQDKAPNNSEPQAQALTSSLLELQGKLDAVMQNLLAQAILSQKGRSEVNYYFQQIPNAMTNPPKDFEIVIKRDGEGKESIIDPNNTQVVMSLETESMGKVIITMIVKDKKVYVIFMFAEKDAGTQGRTLIAKEFGDLQQKLIKNNYMVTGYQVKVDPAMCHIKTYLIPLLPNMDDLLKRISLEA